LKPTTSAEIFSKRRAGVLLHPTSLPGAPDGGSFGIDAVQFLDFLASAGFSVWQMLPLGPTHTDGSPYQCQSVHAGDERLIDLQALRDAGWLDDRAVSRAAQGARAQCLVAAYGGFQRAASEEQRRAFAGFVKRQRFWLEDYALYRALRARFEGRPWYEWPEALRDRDPVALAAENRNLAASIDQVRFEQFLFSMQWQTLREQARQRGILLFGDMPIFVAHDSADVWAHREWFWIDAQGQPTVVAGVPPDYFSATGQRWGNPLYRWDALAADGYRWWIERLESQLTMFDLLRIDHFRGFEAYWEIAAAEPTAINGRWVPGPRAAFFEALATRFKSLPLVAEDLGVITPAVTELRDTFGFPGMKILQFAFDGGPANPYLPHNHRTRAVVYTGTHDNDTILGWYADLSDPQKARVREYFGQTSEKMPWLLIRAAFASVACMSIVPLQDLLELDGEHRMNTPGTTAGNWRWRFEWSQIPADLASKLRGWNRMYGRCE